MFPKVFFNEESLLKQYIDILKANNVPKNNVLKIVEETMSSPGIKAATEHFFYSK